MPVVHYEFSMRFFSLFAFIFRERRIGDPFSRLELSEVRGEERRSLVEGRTLLSNKNRKSGQERPFFLPLVIHFAILQTTGIISFVLGEPHP